MNKNLFFKSIKDNMVRDFLYQEYIIFDKSIDLIADEIGCSRNTVWLCLKKYTIAIKSIKYRTAMLREKLIGRKFSKKTLLKMRKNRTDVSGKNNPNYKDGRKKKPVFCIDCGKQLSDYKAVRCHKCSHIYFGLTHRLENNTNYKDGKCLLKYYCIDCGKELTNYTAKRCIECNGKFHRGQNAINWRGGISFEPYPIEFNKKFKERIRIRDNHTCQLCEKKQENCKRKLSVHHIDYNKKNLNPDNLISLCINCHNRTNRNREFWKTILTK